MEIPGYTYEQINNLTSQVKVLEHKVALLIEVHNVVIKAIEKTDPKLFEAINNEPLEDPSLEMSKVEEEILQEQRKNTGV